MIFFSAVLERSHDDMSQDPDEFADVEVAVAYASSVAVTAMHDVWLEKAANPVTPPLVLVNNLEDAVIYAGAVSATVIRQAWHSSSHREVEPSIVIEDSEDEEPVTRDVVIHIPPVECSHVAHVMHAQATDFHTAVVQAVIKSGVFPFDYLPS